MSIEEIIKGLENTARLFDNMRKHQPETGGSGTADILRAAIAKLKTHPEAQPNEPQGDGWIAIKDRLPEPLEDVLVFYPFTYGGEPKVDMGFIYHAGDWAYWKVYGQPTHWRPLPEPPEEVANGS